MKQIGFTLIELMIVLAIIGIIVILSIQAVGSGPITIDRMVNGRSICKGGYLYNEDTQGFQQQVIGEQGGGVPCN